MATNGYISIKGASFHGVQHLEVGELASPRNGAPSLGSMQSGLS